MREGESVEQSETLFAKWLLFLAKLEWMNVLVLGGTNFIGAHAVRRLISQGHNVTVFHRGETEAKLPEGVRHVYGDRKNLADHAVTFRNLKPDVVLDTLAMVEKDAENVMRVFPSLAERLVVLSSGDVYRAYDRLTGKDPGPPDPTPLTEASPLRDKLYHYRDNASSPDDRSYYYDKILVERAVMRQPDLLPTTVLRLPMVFGPGDYQHRLFPYLKRMDDQRPHILLAKNLAGLRVLRGYAEDMAEAIALCVTSEKAANRVYHVAYPDNFTEEQWVHLIAEAAGWRGKVLQLPEEAFPENQRHGLDTRQDWSLDSSHIREELGYREAVSVEEALRRAVAWERANPPDNIPMERFDYAAEDRTITAYNEE